MKMQINRLLEEPSFYTVTIAVKHKFSRVNSWSPEILASILVIYASCRVSTSLNFATFTTWLCSQVRVRDLLAI